MVDLVRQPSLSTPTPVTEALLAPVRITSRDLLELALSNNDSPGVPNVLSFDLKISTILRGDCNLDGEVTFLDIAPFIAILQAGTFLEEADVNNDGEVTFFDIAPFIQVLAAS